ncbi:MAG: KOW motif-containing protein [Lentisphaeria bacterium]|jgi:large subunit ribosomal protein L24|nr:KOW motif-containing protein [Lentisphaeria bacterium]
MNTFHVKKGDKVVVNAGNFKGAEATVSAILAAKERVVLELTKGENKLGKRTVKKSKANPNGGLVERSVSVAISNVALTDECKQAKLEAKNARRAAKAAAKGKTE